MRSTTAQVSGMKAGAGAALCNCIFIAAAVLAWCLLLVLEIVPQSYSQAVSALMSVMLFILAIPLGVLVRLDTLGGSFGVVGSLLAALCIVTANFLAIGALHGLIASRLGRAHE